MDNSQSSERQLLKPKRYGACSEAMQIECLYVLLYTTEYVNNINTMI